MQESSPSRKSPYVESFLHCTPVLLFVLIWRIIILILNVLFTFSLLLTLKVSVYSFVLLLSVLDKMQVATHIVLSYIVPWYLPYIMDYKDFRKSSAVSTDTCTFGESGWLKIYWQFFNGCALQRAFECIKI